MMYNVLDMSKSGLKAMQTQIDSTANDIANVNTFGYKKKNISFQELMLNEMREEEVMMAGGNNFSINAGSRSGVGKTEFRQGNLTTTGGEFHLAIEGEGFFGLRDENDNFLLTRNGNFHINEDLTITNDQGQFLEMNLEKPIEEWSEGKIFISDEGVITDMDHEVLGNIPLYSPMSKDSLTSLGEMNYLVNDMEVFNSIDTPNLFGSIIQGALENSNVDLSESMVDLITTQRAYSANNKLIQTVDEIITMINGIKQ